MIHNDRELEREEERRELDRKIHYTYIEKDGESECV